MVRTGGIRQLKRLFKDALPSPSIYCVYISHFLYFNSLHVCSHLLKNLRVNVWLLRGFEARQWCSVCCYCSATCASVSSVTKNKVTHPSASSKGINKHCSAVLHLETRPTRTVSKPLHSSRAGQYIDTVLYRDIRHDIVTNFGFCY